MSGIVSLRSIGRATQGVLRPVCQLALFATITRHAAPAAETELSIFSTARSVMTAAVKPDGEKTFSAQRHLALSVRGSVLEPNSYGAKSATQEVACNAGCKIFTRSLISFAKCMDSQMDWASVTFLPRGGIDVLGLPNVWILQ